MKSEHAEGTLSVNCVEAPKSILPMTAARSLTSTALTSAPRRISSLTTSRWPPYAAKCSGVRRCGAGSGSRGARRAVQAMPEPRPAEAAAQPGSRACGQVRECDCLTVRVSVSAFCVPTCASVQ